MDHDQVLRCGECGMALESWAEYHPMEACDLYKAGFNPRHSILPLRAEMSGSTTEGAG